MSASTDVLDYFVDCMQHRLPAYRLPRGSRDYVKELAFTNQLLKKCGGDARVAKFVIDETFRRFEVQSMLNTMRAGFPARLAKAVQRARAIDAQSVASSRAADIAAQRSDLFEVED